MSRILTKLGFLGLAAVLCLYAGSGYAQDRQNTNAGAQNAAPGHQDYMSKDQASPATKVNDLDATGENTDADNTAVNRRDRDASQPTADQGKNNSTDLDNMKAIRRAIIKDASLSTYAHNIKVISTGGKVTLKGPVKSEEEINKVESKAADVVGPSNIVNQMSVLK